MSRLRTVVRKYKAVLSFLVLAVSIMMMLLAMYGIPDKDANEGDGPLAPLGGLNIIIIIITFIIAIVSGYIIYKYISDRSKFEVLMNTNSQAIFKRNQMDIERLALRLTNKEEERVLEAMKRYRIK